ncbi:Fc.00g043470.m01.CDS01 [Cosmosporella sp. VM-42]
MASPPTTLRRVLSQRKPLVRCNTTATRNSTSENWPKLEECVKIWDDFNLSNLNESYGHVLDLPVPEQLLMAPQPGQAFAGIAINKAEDINHLISWNDGLMQPSLQFAKSHLRLYPGILLRHKYSTADKSFIAKISSAPRLSVDHLIALDDFPSPHLVAGLGRPSPKWSGRKLAHQLDNPTMELLWPLMQLANICKAAGTRYGYIQTDEELVVCCFSKEVNGETGTDWKAAIMPIPWSRHGVDVLTTDLALWWLCMLAMSGPHHRAIVEDGEMVKINAWDVVHLDEERGWVRRHRYSSIEVPTSPPPPPQYTPPLGNATAFDWQNNEDPLANLVDFGAANFDLDQLDFGNFQ